MLRRVFDPFFTTKGAVHGVGLGLFVAEGLVRAAGGRLTATNRPEGGARFRVELPDASADADSPRHAPHNAAHHAPNDAPTHTPEYGATPLEAR